MLEMNPEIRARWVAALRSGEYEQGMSRLREDDAFCCMGVLCDLAVKDGALPPPDRFEDSGTYVYGNSFEYLPSSILGWAGLKDYNPEVVIEDEDGTERERLAALNDDRQWSFTQIADAIEVTP